MTISALGGNQPPLSLPSQAVPVQGAAGGGTGGTPAVQQQSSVQSNTGSSSPLLTPAAVQQALDQVRKAVNNVAPDSLQFSVDSSSGKMVIQVMDTQTNQVLQQIPSENMLAIAQSLDKMQGLLFKQKA